MKKQHLLSSLFLLALLASCNMNGHKLFADGDSDDEQLPTNQQQQEALEGQTLNTSWSAMSTAVLMAGGTEQEAMRFDKEFNTKRSERNTEAFSAAYASQRVKGTSEEEAITFAKEEASAPRGIYYYMVLATHPPAVALSLSNLYEAKRRSGKSEAWAGAYASKVVLEEKTDEEAQAYALELETSFTMMNQFSTVAQAGDMEEQGLRPALYRAALRADKPLSFAKTFADHVEAQLKAGKSGDWALAYASRRAHGEDDTLASTYADHVEAQRKAGKSGAWADNYTAQRVYGKSDTFASTYADHVEAQLKAGKSDDWAFAYASQRAQGQDDTWARTLADHREAQMKAGKSQVWALAYASRRAQGQDDTFASTYADHKEAQLKAGKSQVWAQAYASMRAQVGDDTYARTFANHVEEQRKAGKSVEWASTYASMRAQDQSGKFANTYADHYEMQLKAGKSHAWAGAYAEMRAQGKSHQEAEAQANRQHLNG